jgi:hypothetical protein
MAYSVTNPPALLSSNLDGTAQVWIYKSTDDENAFDDTDYITNASELGMKTGDVVFAIDSTNGLTSVGKVTVDADGNGTLSAFTAIA